jgi:NAD-dependent protein deacetylase/lipoamidase
MKHIVILTGAGMSAESGLKTFRDSGGLWEGYDIYEVATFEAWQKNPELVLDFYNMRRRDLLNAKPNDAHFGIVALEKKYKVTVITQNVDDLHERAGSSHVLHLHGELLKARSTKDYNLRYAWKKDLNLGDTCELGSQLRPHIVWFGEQVPMIEEAAEICRDADIFIVIGTSLAVYPAAGLIHYVPDEVVKYIIDPNLDSVSVINNLKYYKEKATTGVKKLLKELLNEQ